MTTDSEPLVSVVTPFYNTDAYLAECIESVLAQSYRNFEYILVDNQSTDKSRSIAEHYQSRDQRIRLSQTPSFYTQVQNYNFALQQISPQSHYCKIVQADDWLFPRCLTEMVRLGTAHPSVALIGSYHLQSKCVLGTGIDFSECVIQGKEACRRHLLEEFFLFGSPTTVMYRSDVVISRQPFYSEGRLHEDTEAAFEILATCDFGFVHQVLSSVRTQDASITGTSRDYNPNVLDHLICLKLYGHQYLTRTEYSRELAGARRHYYRGLADAWLARQGKEFFDYHRNGLATIGEELDRGRMFRHALIALIDKSLRLGEAASSIARSALNSRRNR